MPESIRVRLRHPGWIAGGVVALATAVLIGDSYYLRLRVECEKPDGYMILIGAVLHRAT